MKIRSGFVSNSSSSSFIIIKDKISDNQKDIIYNHINIGKEIDDKLISEGKELLYEYYEEWYVKEDDLKLEKQIGKNNILESNYYYLCIRNKKLKKILKKYERN